MNGDDSLKLKSWIEFTEVVWVRFGHEVFENITIEFDKLVQTPSVIEYQNKFE